MRLSGSPWALLLLAAGAAAAEDIPNLIVTASRTSETAGLASVTVLTREDIERAQARSVQDVLRGLPGLQVSSSGGPGKATSIFLRGTNADQVLVLVDGVKIGSATLGTTAFENLPVDAIERIDVVRGPRSSLYGSEAIGGVIHIITRRGGGGVPSPELALGAGSFGTRHLSAGLSGGGRALWFDLSASRLESDGYDVRDATPREPDADGYENTAFALRAGRTFGEGFEAELHWLHSDGYTEFDSGFVNEADLRQQVLGANLAFRPAGFWRARLQAGRSFDKQENGLDGAFMTRFDSERDTLSLLNDFTIREGRLVTVGVDLHRDRVESTTEYTENERRNTGVFAQLSTALRDHELLLAARRDDNEQFGGATTGSVAWGYSPGSSVSLRASVGTAFKAPSLNQLYFPGFGNPTLEPERSTTAEIGFLADSRLGELCAAVYHTDVRDLIAFDPVTFFPENIARARVRGAELGHSFHGDVWEVRTALDLIEPENRSSDANRGLLLPRRARRTLSLEVHRDLERLRIGARVVAQSERFDDLANRERLGGFAVVDLLGEYALRGSWRLQMRIENLFDRRYQTAASFNQPGRGVYLTLRHHVAGRGPQSPSQD